MMATVQTIPYSDTLSFSKLAAAYVQRAENLLPYISAFPDDNTILHQIEERKKQFAHRSSLVSALQRQYQTIPVKQITQEQIETLHSQQTFTITTAHQPCIFTGPLYVIYKTLHAILLSRQYKQKFPDYHFVPVFYIGSEDHDLDEIGTVQVKQKVLHWQTKQQGSCGEMNTAELLPILNEIQKLFPFPNNAIKELLFVFQQAFGPNKTLAEATREILHHLFGDYGLLVFDANERACKALFQPIMQEELIHQVTFPLVEQTKQKLEELYTVPVQPRKINLFYKRPNEVRERIEWDNSEYQVLHTDLRFSQEQILEELQTHPERFSPNVVLRPLLQEMLLPNVAFVGGGAEIGYWLELKLIFERYKIPYPLLYLRQSVMVIPEHWKKKMEAAGIQPKEIFQSVDDWLKHHAKHSDTMQEFQQWKDSMLQEFKKIDTLATSISVNLSESVKAHAAKQQRILQRVEEKFMAHLKRNDTDRKEGFQEVREALFPEGKLQERQDNILDALAYWGESFIGDCLQAMEKVDDEFIILLPNS